MGTPHSLSWTLNNEHVQITNHKRSWNIYRILLHCIVLILILNIECQQCRRTSYWNQCCQTFIFLWGEGKNKVKRRGKRGAGQGYFEIQSEIVFFGHFSIPNWGDLFWSIWNTLNEGAKLTKKGKKKGVRGQGQKRGQRRELRGRPIKALKGAVWQLSDTDSLLEQ